MTFKVENRADVPYANLAKLYETYFDALVASYRGNGVLRGFGVTAWGTPGMGINLASGQARVEGYFPAYTSGSVTFSPVATSGSARWDLVSIDYNGVVSVTQGSLGAHTGGGTPPVPPNIPSNNTALFAVYIPQTATQVNLSATSDGHAKVVLLDIPVRKEQFDLDAEFMSGSVETGEIGGENWNATQGGTAGSAQQAGDANHPGILRVQTGTTSGNNSRIHPGVAVTTGVMLPTEFTRMQFIIRVPTNTTVTVKVGLGQDVSVQTAGEWGTAGAFFEYDSATNANWRTNTRQASTSTTNTSSVACTNNDWEVLEMVRLQNGDIQFLINEAIIFTHSANLPTTACNIGIMVQTGAAAARSVDADFFGVNFLPFTQRWT